MLGVLLFDECLGLGYFVRANVRLFRLLRLPALFTFGVLCDDVAS